MRTSLGISAGNEVVCSALVSTAPHGELRFDYRMVSADSARPDLGDLVASSIELMTTRLPAGAGDDAAFPSGRPRADRSAAPTSVAVAYRSEEQAHAIRAATGKQRSLRLIPEGTATLAYLRHTGMLDRYQTVGIIDLGASGLTVTVADHVDGAVLRSERTTAVSGRAIDDLVYHHLVDLHFARRGTRPNRGTLTNRGRAAKEHLSTAPAVTIDHVAGRPLKLTRADFEEIVSVLLRDAATFTGGVFARAETYPEAVVVIGGGANIPAIVSTLRRRLPIPVHTVDDPDAVIAKGAALVADSVQPAGFPVTTLAGDAPVGTFTKVVGTLAGAIVVIGLVIGYGVRTFAPTADEVSPAGTTSSTRYPTPTAPVGPGGTATSSVPVTTAPATTSTTTTAPAPTTPGPTVPNPPTLRPDPNLPPIPFPELLAPLIDGRAPAQVPHSEGHGTPLPSALPTQTPAHSHLPLPQPTPAPIPFGPAPA